MSIIEKAVERLEQLQRASGNANVAPREEPQGEPLTAVPAPASEDVSPVVVKPAVETQPVEKPVAAPKAMLASNPDRFVEIDARINAGTATQEDNDLIAEAVAACV